MSKRQIQTKAGFTIIEVVLVLAIAGLIFMMVFLALPALQRAQRDTQRSDDIARLQAAINSYQANNRGRLPSDQPEVVVGETTKAAVKTTNNDGKWATFYANYLLVGSGNATDTFEDPDGSPYGLNVVNCGSSLTDSPAAGADCTNAAAKVYDFEFDDQSSGNVGGQDLQNGANHAITIVLKATCNGEVPVASTGACKVAITYKKEGGGAVCLNNQSDNLKLSKKSPSGDFLQLGDNLSFS